MLTYKENSSQKINEYKSSLYTALFVINRQQHVSAIKAIFRLNTIIIWNINFNAMNITDQISSYIKWGHYKV